MSRRRHSDEGSLRPHHETHAQQSAHHPATRSVKAPAATIAIAGYLLLALRSKAAWGALLWPVLAFLVVPAVAGLVGGLKVRRVGSTRAHFWDAFRAVGWTMGSYTLISLMVLRLRFQMVSFAQVALVWLLVSTVYGALAGAVAGAVATLAAGEKRRESVDEPAS